jgi:hypothetical protein
VLLNVPLCRQSLSNPNTPATLSTRFLVSAVMELVQSSFEAQFQTTATINVHGK